MIALLAQLFLTFFLIGMFTFGGGYAMLSLIQAEVVVKHAWLSITTWEAKLRRQRHPVNAWWQGAGAVGLDGNLLACEVQSLQQRLIDI